MNSPVISPFPLVIGDMIIFREKIPYQVSSIPFTAFILVGNLIGISSVSIGY